MADFASNCLVDTLAKNANLRCLNPLSQNSFQLPDIVTIMDRELSIGVVPLLHKTTQDYFVRNYDVPIVQGQSAYILPTRAIGNALRDVVLLDAGGNEVALNNLEREYIKVHTPFNYVPAIWYFGQYMTANEVNLWNTMVTSYSAYKLRFITERRPGGLTLSTNCGQINTITGNIVTVGYVDPDWTTSTTFDIINPLPPFQSIADDVSITLINGSQITLSSVPSGLAVNQWLCPAMLSCIPQLPYEMFALLEERTVAAMAEALDMSQLLAASKAKIQEFEANALATARPRVRGSPKKIINKDSMIGRYGMGFFR